MLTLGIDGVIGVVYNLCIGSVWRAYPGGSGGAIRGVALVGGGSVPGADVVVRQAGSISRLTVKLPPLSLYNLCTMLDNHLTHNPHITRI